MARTPEAVLDASRRRYPEAYRAESTSSFVRACVLRSIDALDKFATRSNDAARRRWSSDRDVEWLMRAPVAPAAIGGGPPMARVTMSLLEALVPTSAGADLLSRSVTLDFDGAAQISVPAIAPPNAGGFVSEGAPIPAAVETTSAGTTLVPHKLATITSLSGEILRNSNAEPLVRQVLLESVGPTVDKAMFSTSAAGAAPPGLLYNINPLTPTATGEKSQIIIDDIQVLALAVAQVAGNGNVTLVGSPDAATALQLRLYNVAPWPILTSAALAPKTIIAIAANAVVSAVDGAPVIEVSRETEYVPDTVPQEVVTSGGVVATSLGSTFQKDSVALRLKWPITWALRTPTGIAWMSGVNW